jgi:hypothetical protein
MSYLADTAVYAKPSNASGSLGQLVYIAPDPANPEAFLNVRLTNGDGFYTAGGTTVSGGAVLTSDQGAPGLLSSAWPVKLSDGSSVVGVEATPLWVTGSIGLTSMMFTTISGSVQGLLVGGNPVSQNNTLPVQTFDPILQSAYDMTTSSTVIYVGQAIRGAAETEVVWNIKKTEFDASGNPLTLKWATGVSWLDRTGSIFT